MTTATATPRRGRGRPKGSKTKNRSNGSADPRDAEIALLREQLSAAKLQSQSTLAPIPPATEELPPGSLIVIGRDASGSEIKAKTRWTREWMAKTYPEVRFTPKRTLPVTPNGVRYQLVADEEFVGPQIVKDIYDEMLRTEASERMRYRPETPMEKYELAVKASEQPGKHFSRVSRLGYGLQTRITDPGDEMWTPGEEVKP